MEKEVPPEIQKLYMQEKYSPLVSTVYISSHRLEYLIAITRLRCPQTAQSMSCVIK